MNIVVVKLTTSEEVIGKKVGESTTSDKRQYIELENSRVLMMQNDGQGGLGIGMLPFMPSSMDAQKDTEVSVRIYSEFIMAEPVSVPKTLEDGYLSKVSNIQIL